MNLTVNVNSTNRTKYILWQTFQKVDSVNNRSTVCRFSVKNYRASDWTPALGDEIEVLDGATTIFGGVITKLYRRMNGIRLEYYNVECKDWVQYFDKKLVVESYTNDTINNIISDLVSNYSVGFTTNNVDCAITIDTVKFNYKTLSNCIQALAEQVNYSWYIDVNKDVHFFAKNTNLSPFNLTDTNGNYINNSLLIKDDLSQLRNIVTIRGGEKEGTSRDEELWADGNKKTFPLGNKFSSIPVLATSGSPLKIGIENLNTGTPYEAFWDYNQKYIRFTDAPANGSPLTATGTPLIPIIVEVRDEDSINDYGEYEFKKIDKTISSTDEARQYAIAQLDAYKNSLNDGSFRTYTSGLESGQTINIQSDIRSIDEDYIIQKVMLQMRGYNEGVYSVEFASLRTIGIIDFLQKLLLRDDKEIKIDEDEVLEKFYTDHKNIQITEEIGLDTEQTDHQSIGITESIRKDPFTPKWVLGKTHPRSIYFDASSSQYANLGSDVSMEGFFKMTVAFWLKMSAFTGSYRGVIDGSYFSGVGSPYGIMVRADDNNDFVRVFLRNTANSTAAISLNYTPDVWTHIAFSWDGANVTYYQNGVQIGAIDLLVGQISCSGANWKLAITAGYAYTSCYFDEVYIYRRNLSATEIANLVEGNNVSTDRLVGRWYMDEKTGTTIKDTSGKGNNGTLVNSPTRQNESDEDPKRQMRLSISSYLY